MEKTIKLVPEGIGEVLYDQMVDGKQTNVAVRIYDVVDDEIVTYVYRGVWECALAVADYGPEFVQNNMEALKARKFTMGLMSYWPTEEEDPEFILKAMGVKDLAKAVELKVSPKSAEEWWKPVLEELTRLATSVAEAAAAILVLRVQLAMGGASEWFKDEAARLALEELNEKHLKKESEDAKAEADSQKRT